MKFNRLTFLFASTILVTTAASAMQGELSDALNGLNVPEKDYQAHVAKIKQKLGEKADRKGHIFEQINRHFAPITRKGDDHDRVIVNAILDVLEHDTQRAEYQRELYDSYDENGRPPVINSMMKDQPPKAGHHIAMVRDIEKLSGELKALNVLIDKRPEEKTQLLQKQKNSAESFANLERETSELEKQKLGHQKKQTEYKRKIELEEEKIGQLREDIEKVKRQLDDNKNEKSAVLSPKNQILSELVKVLEELEEEKTSLTEQLAALALQENSLVEKEETGESTQSPSKEDLETKNQSEEGEMKETVDPLVDQNDSLEEKEDVKSIESNPSLSAEDPDKKNPSESLRKRLESIESEMTSKKSDIEAFTLEIQKVEDEYKEPLQSLETHKKEIEMSLGQSTVALEKLKESLTKEVEEPLALVEKKREENSVKTEQIQKEVTEIEETLRSFDGESEALRTKSTLQQMQLRTLQDEADLYALIKYFKYLNFYLTLPNDDFSQAHEDKLETLSYYDRPKIRQLVNRRAAEVGKYNVETTVPREIGKYSKVASDYLTNFNYKKLMIDIITSNDRNISFYNDGKGPFIESIEKNLKNSLTTKKFDEVYAKDQNRHGYYPEPISDEDWSQEIQILDTTRADRLFKQSALKWKNKLSSQPDSLIHRLGFVTALFHKDFDFQNITTLLSFKELHDSLPVDVLRAPDTVDWKFASVQLKTNFSQEWTDKGSPVHERITPILAFVNHKASKTLKKELVKGDQEKSVEKSFLQMMSYMNMSYALTHDLEGNKTASLYLIDPALEPYITKDSISVAQRLDYVMANKALKWADRLWEHGEVFIEGLGLKSWFLDNYPFAKDEKKSIKSAKSKKENSGF